jgi:hypothetical protein
VGTDRGMPTIPPPDRFHHKRLTIECRTKSFILAKAQGPDPPGPAGPPPAPPPCMPPQVIQRLIIRDPTSVCRTKSERQGPAPSSPQAAPAPLARHLLRSLASLGGVGVGVLLGLCGGSLFSAPLRAWTAFLPVAVTVGALAVARVEKAVGRTGIVVGPSDVTWCCIQICA